MGMLALTTPGVAIAQSASDPPDHAQAASGETHDTAGRRYTGPSLPRTHWAVEAARRVDALGLSTDYLPAQRTVPLDVVERTLRQAAERASAADPDLAALTAAWYARLLAEFPRVTGARAGRRSVVADGGAGAGYLERAGAVGPGTGEIEPHRTGARPLPDRSEVLGETSAAITIGASLGASVNVEMAAGTPRARSFEISGTLRGWRLRAGRIPIGYAYGFGGGTMLTGDSPLNTVQLQTDEPRHLPGILSRLGPVALHVFFGQLREERHPDRPMLWGVSGQFRPGRRLVFGVNRSAMFGGDHAVTFERVVDMMIGRVAGIGFENQIVSLSGRVILPTESLVPLEFHFEWGAEDAAGGWRDVPGRVVGLWSPSLPFAPGASIGVELAGFASSCCGNPSWYRHWSFNGSWASRETPLGHPVGGDGSETRIHAALELVDSRVTVYGEAYRRERRSENLYSPGRTGKSLGSGGGFRWFATPRLRIVADGAFENGDGWAETRIRAQGEMSF